MASWHLRDTELVAQARGLCESAPIRPVLNAALLVSEAFVQSAADDLFFNVLDRQDDLVFLQKIVGSREPRSLFLSRFLLPTQQESLLAAVFNGMIADVLRIAGLAKDDGEMPEDYLPGG